MKQFLFFISLIWSVASAQSLTKTEQQIAALIDNDYQESLALLKASVDINSGTFNVEGVRKVGVLYAKELAAIGFDTTWVNLPDSLKRAGHLVATRQGKKGKKLLLIGHLDTVFEPDMPKNPFTMLNDSTATGQGVTDMKGGDVLIISALKALQQLHLLDDASITVYLTGDEENTGNPKSVTRGDMIQRAKQHDIALAFEGANSLPDVAIARRGTSNWRLEVTATQAHSSGVLGRNGFGAVYEAARIVDSFRRALGHERFLTFNPGTFVGGTEVNFDEQTQSFHVSGKTNIISPKAVVLGDIRFISEEQKERTRRSMQEIVAASLPGASAKISFQDSYPAMPPTDGNKALAKLLNDVSTDLGYGAVIPGDPGGRGAGDISFVASYVDGIDGLGVMGHGEHAPGETIDLSTYKILAKRAAVLMYRLTR